MILVGLLCEWSNCVGTHGKHKVYFECEDYHEAARCTLRTNYSTGFQLQRVLSGEFHDTVTGKTWSVDNAGHTKKDYRKERGSVFSARWSESS